MRWCCDEKCGQGRACPARHPFMVDWIDGFVLGICATSFVAILAVVLL